MHYITAISEKTLKFQKLKDSTLDGIIVCLTFNLYDTQDKNIKMKKKKKKKKK